MEKFSLKSLLTIVVILLIGIVAIWRINQGPKKVEAGWFNEAWSYRKAITLTNSGTGQTNVYVALTIGTSDTSRFQADAGDIRFTKQNGELLPYYIVSGAGTSSTLIHINFDIYPAGASTFYLYYGNSSADNGFSTSNFTTAASNSSTNLLTEELSPAPIAYWNFDEGVGTTVYDSSNNKKHGVLFVGNSAPSWQNQENCISNKCLYFDGDDSIETSLDSSWNQNNSVSWSFWIKPSSTASRAGILGKKYPSWEWAFYQEGNQLNLVYWNSSGGHTNGMDDGWGSVLQVGQWSHIVYTWDGSISRFYANGKLVNSHTATDPSINQDRTNNVMIGGNIYVWADKYFNGYLDEIKSYPYARTATQIKQDYNAGRAGIGSMKGGSVNVGGTQVRNIKDHLVIHYKMDEGVGTTAFNFGSGGATYNARLTGETRPAWTKNGKINGALQFLGTGTTNRSILQSANPLQIGASGNSITLSFWINPDATQNGNGWIVRSGAGTDQNYSLRINSNSGGNFKLAMERYIGSFQNSATVNNIVPQSIWSHIVVIITEGVNWKVYKNGNYIETVSVGGTTSNSGSLNIGGHTGTSSQYFNGYLDDFKIYNTALSDAEIKLDYNQGAQFVMGKTNQTIGGTTTSLEYCIPGDTSHCAPPIAEYKFDEGIGTTAFDTSGNNINTGFSGTPTWIQGKIGKALNFNGSNNNLVNTSKIISGGLGLTFGVWVKTTSTDSSVVYAGNAAQNIIGDTNGGSVSFGFGIHGGKVRYTQYAGTWQNVTGNISVNDGLWHYISVTHKQSNGDIIIYVDGKQDITGNLTYNGSNRYDVIARGYAGDFYTGELDNFRIYNYARTPAQIAYDYNKGAPVGWWKFDECEGTMINDWSGIGNTGTLVIGAGGSQVSVGTCSIGNTSAWSNGATGKINSAMSFDGKDDWVNAGSSDIFSYSDGNTFSMWVYGTSRFADGATLLSRQGQSNPGFYWLMIYQNKGFLQYWNGSSNINLMTTNTLPVSQNKWFHYAITISGETVNYYVDGKLIESKQATNIRKDKITSNLYIGGYQAWTTNWQFEGLLDDVRIYNYALTSEQVKQVYNNGAVNFR